MKPLSTTPDSFRGILIFKVLLVLGCVGSIISATTGIASVSTTAHGTVVTYHTPTSRLISVGLAVVFATFCYGLHRRWVAVWRIGFILLVLGCLNFVWGMWVTSRLDPHFPPVVPLVFGAFGGGAVTVYWWTWWYRQRPYFSSSTPVT